jgi:hypothetical protein
VELEDMTHPYAGPGAADGIAFARTREDFDLPVIDVTHPRFAVPADPAAVDRLGAALMADEQRRRYLPDFLMRMMLRAAARKSRLVHALFRAETGFLDSISTYVMKLGADNLVPPFDSPVDRRLASSPHIVLVRLRMQQLAYLMADALAGDLAAADAAAPLSLINIGGGPALDSINALIVLRKARPGLLNRPVAIEVLDADADGAFFGANALAALKAEHGPLAGLDIVMRHHDYDWDQPATLKSLVGKLASAGAIIAASSEGALFEYGSDQAIVENLTELRADGADGAGARSVAGSVTSAGNTRRRMINRTLFKLKPRGLEGVAPLVAQGGFRIVRSEPAFLSTQVLLRPA